MSRPADASGPTSDLTVFDGLGAVRASVGAVLGPGPWTTVEPAQLDRYAEATGDRATDESGRPVAPAGLILALTNLLLPQIVEVRGVSAGVNYGTGPVRFGAPVPAGGRIRARGRIAAVEEVRGGVQTTMAITVELDGAAEPACTVEPLSRWLA